MCASLVDKLPNLAGLSRTCEIFGAQSLLVPNKNALLLNKLNNSDLLQSKLNRIVLMH